MDLRRLSLKADIEQFLFTEAELLDQRRFTEWLDLLADDLVYFMPLRRNVPAGDHAEHENTKLGQDINWFDEDKWTLTKRVEQIMTGIHWAEEPLSRITHMVSNVQVEDISPPDGDPRAATVRSRFLIYQNRVETETYLFVGRRIDRLRKDGASWRLARREILLEQNVLLAKNLTVFF
ncbi:MAG TPA: 3-phenylpropionate/cinnamic acid dioxygenase subunit beta [Candidatus Aquilonibacter sp.]